MSRTQDLVLARLRLIAMRWQGGPSAATETTGRVDGSGEVLDREDVDELGPDADPPDADPPDADPPDPDPADPDPADPDPADPDPPDADPTDSAWPVPGMAVRLVGLLVVVVAIGVTAVLVVSWPRAQPPQTADAPLGTESGDPFADPFPAASPVPSPPVMVHVAGDVRHPGVFRLPGGSRVVDAVRAAGGLRRGGEVGATNLARVLADGERIEVGVQLAGVASEAGGAAGGSGGLLDLNVATAEQLDALPGIGPVTAAKILGWRSAHKRFSVVDELAEVPGIGPKTLAELRPLVRV